MRQAFVLGHDGRLWKNARVVCARGVVENVEIWSQKREGVTGGNVGEVGLCRMPGVARLLTGAGARLFVSERDT